MALPLRMNINTALAGPTASSLSSHEDELVNVDATPTPSTPQTPPTPDTAGNLVFNRIPSLQLQQGGGGGSADHNMLKRKSGSNCKCFPLPLHYANSSGATACSWMNNSCGTVGAEDGGGGHPYSASCVYATCAYPPVPSVSLSRKIGAEFIGTFILIFAGTASAIVNEKTGGSVSSVGLAASAGLAVMIVILATGHISGAHLNPSLTVAFAALRHFPWIQVPAYVSAQLMASVCAAFVLKGVFHPDLHGGVTVPSGAQWQAFILEFIISFNLMFVVTAVATDTRAVGELAGIAVGATVTMNILIAGATTGASMNPVRTLGPAIASKNFKALWVYMVGPIFGALAGAAAYTLVRLKGEDGSSTTPRRSFRR